MCVLFFFFLSNFGRLSIIVARGAFYQSVKSTYIIFISLHVSNWCIAFTSVQTLQALFAALSNDMRLAVEKKHTYLPVYTDRQTHTQTHTYTHAQTQTHTDTANTLFLTICNLEMSVWRLMQRIKHWRNIVVLMFSKRICLSLSEKQKITFIVLFRRFDWGEEIWL